MLVETFDTSLFCCETEHRVLDDVVRDASLAECAAEFRVLCDRQAFVARENHAFRALELLSELSDDGLFCGSNTHELHLHSIVIFVL